QHCGIDWMILVKAPNLSFLSTSTLDIPSKPWNKDEEPKFSAFRLHLAAFAPIERGPNPTTKDYSIPSAMPGADGNLAWLQDPPSLPSEELPPPHLRAKHGPVSRVERKGYRAY
ncbi:hypothetical protein VNI00_018730, partial [Paramarasmius palmivorus]